MRSVPEGITICLFDLDGVLTQTAKIHAHTWKEMFDDFLWAWANHTGDPFEVGVDGTRQAEALRRRGADVVVQDLGDLLEDP